MISIIICSREKTISATLSENIKDTIGCDYELIIINNSENQYSIFEAYNLGIKKSRGEYLCLMHDDIKIHSNSWGSIINNIFEENIKVGMIGVAGTKYKSKTPSAWWECLENQKVINIIQHFNNEDKDIITLNMGFNLSSNVNVATVDGVFMVIRKVLNICFSDKLKGFHNYDLNICFEYYSKGYDILVTDKILIEHYSIGKIDESWCKSTLAIHKIYNKLLPLNIKTSSSKSELISLEFRNGKNFLYQLLNYGYLKDVFKLWIELIKLKPISKFHLKFIKSLILYACNRNPLL